MRSLFSVGVFGLFAFFFNYSIFSFNANAALPPYWERAREVSEIMHDDSVSQALNLNPIESVRYIRANFFEVSSGKCIVKVQLETLVSPPHFVGPRHFQVKVVGSEGCGNDRNTGNS